MPICHNRKLIFCHIPKCAGSSIEKSMELQSLDFLFSYKPTGICLPHLLENFSGTEKNIVFSRTPQHLTLPHLKKILRGDVWNSYQKFAVVRNPYSRMWSEYLYVKRNGNKRFNTYRCLSFISFLKAIETLPRVIRCAVFDGHLETQKSYLYEEETLLADKVFTFENLIEVFNFYNLSLLHERNGKSGEWQKNYNRESLDIVNKMFYEDFLTFNYKLL